jgi:hypothetical protein
VVIARFKKVCIDATDPDRLGRFWAGVLGLRWSPYPHGEGGVFGAGEHPVFWVNRVPEPKTVPHRVTVDVYADDLVALTELGARVVRPADGVRPWHALADPEGGEFGVYRPPDRVALEAGHRQRAVVVASADPAELAAWWAGIFGARVEPDRSGGAVVRELPVLPFEGVRFVPEAAAKTIKNRMHWDVAVSDPRALVDAGATVLRPPGGDIGWHVMADPEGNEFCAFTETPG